MSFQNKIVLDLSGLNNFIFKNKSFLLFLSYCLFKTILYNNNNNIIIIIIKNSFK
jgi:hypothetical protein